MFLLRISHLTYTQNRAYAASQISDLAAKLHKAHSSGGPGRNQGPLSAANAILGDVNLYKTSGDISSGSQDTTKGKGVGADGKKKEEGQFDQVIRDR